MTVYVDEIREYPTKPFGHRKWSHMWADSILELRDMADKIGLKQEWYQEHHVLNHFDVTPSKRALALANGAVFKPAREAVKERMGL